jgi:hypothetical protein
VFFLKKNVYPLPYFYSVHPGATPDDPALEDFGTQTGTSFTWTAVNFAVGEWPGSFSERVVEYDVNFRHQSRHHTP